MIVSTSEEETTNVGWTGYRISAKYAENHREEIRKVKNAIEVIRRTKDVLNRRSYVWDRFSLRQKIAMWLLKPFLKSYLTIDNEHLIETEHQKYEDLDGYVAECTVWELGKGWFIARDNQESKQKRIEQLDREIEKLENQK
jgi:hypothetical protein